MVGMVSVGQCYGGHDVSWAGYGDIVSVGQVYGGHGINWTGLWWTWRKLDRVMVDMVSVGQGYGGHGVSWTGFSPCDLVFTLSISFRQCSTLIFVYVLFIPEGQTVQAKEPYSKGNVLSKVGKRLMEKYFTSFKTLIRVGLLCNVQ
jgi:hypothetical protein